MLFSDAGLGYDDGYLTWLPLFRETGQANTMPEEPILTPYQLSSMTPPKLQGAGKTGNESMVSDVGAVSAESQVDLHHVLGFDQSHVGSQGKRRSKSEKSRNHVCQICPGTAFESPSDLLRHNNAEKHRKRVSALYPSAEYHEVGAKGTKQSKDEKPREYVCQICPGIAFSYPSHLSQHYGSETHAKASIQSRYISLT